MELVKNDTQLAETKAQELEQAMLKMNQVDCPVIHRFGPGTYMREVHMPTGAMVVGHHQNLEHTNIFLKGSMTLLCDGQVSEIQAPMIFASKPGRKIAQIHDDCVWINVYPNIENEQDVEKLEAKFLTKSDTFMLSEETRNALLLGNRKHDNTDFFDALTEMGLDKDIFQGVGHTIGLPFDGFKIKVSKSRIHGKGIFATAEIQSGEIIGPALIKSQITVLKKYSNHSRYPNAKFIIGKDRNIDLIATERIFGCRGGFDGDEITVDYREAFKLDQEIIGGLKWQE